MTASPSGQLTEALGQVSQLVAGVRAGQWGSPTGCTEWTVRDLVVHMVGGNDLFAAMLAGMPLEQARAAAQVGPGEDLAARARDSAARLTAAFARPGVMEQEFTIPAGTMPGTGLVHIRLTEMLVHGWDLARATGQAARFADDAAEQELAFAERALPALPPGRSPFGPAQPVPGSAPAILRLVARLGRPVTDT